MNLQPPSPEPSPPSMSPISAHTPITAVDRLTAIYHAPGPYTTVYLATRPLFPGGGNDIDRRWTELRRDLEIQCAPLDALQAIEARLALPAPADSAAIAVIAARDGTTVVDHGMEPPAFDFGVVDTLPYAAPLLEWDQRRVPHLLVSVDEAGADIAVFTVDHRQSLVTVTTTGEALADDVTRQARAIDAELVVLAGDHGRTTDLADRLSHRLGLSCRVVSEPIIQTSDDLADATVRYVMDAAARTTVHYLREQRFLATHDAAVDGTVDTIAALSAGTADLLLIHDDPNDQRRAWIGDLPNQLSLEPIRGHNQRTRLVDAVIRSAVLQGIPVHIIPTTGPAGPDDNTAAFTRRHDVASYVERHQATRDD